MPNSSGKEFDRRYNNRRKSNEDDYYSNVHFQYQDSFNQIYRNSSRDKKNITSFQSSSSDMKQPLRSFGDWSEFLSSNGKIYFYNRKTEIAQWDKPDEWDWLIMQEEKASKNYYQPSSKDNNRGTNRFRNKYENTEIFDPSVKPQRYNNYHRDYSSDYVNSNQSNTFRQNYSLNERYPNQNVSMASFSQSNSVQINDYYDSSQSYPVNTSASNSDYYNKNNPMYRNNNYHNKDWSKMQYIQNGTNSPNNTKNSPRYPNQYDESNINKSYGYQQHRQHTSRYDNYGENSVNNQKYTYNHPNNNCNNNSFQNVDYNNFNNGNNSINSNQSSNINRSNNNLNSKDHKFNPQTNNQSLVQNVSQNQPRSRTNSENNGLSPSNKKFKRSEDNSQSRNVEEPLDETMEDKSCTDIQDKHQSYSQAQIDSSRLNDTKDVKTTKNTWEKTEVNVKTEALDTKENQVEQKHTDPVLTSTVDDINKYYRSDLVDTLASCLGVVENLNWINQSYSKHFNYSKLSLDIKNYRSIVRVKEIKKTQIEQRLFYLQNQMKEIEELLG